MRLRPRHYVLIAIIIGIFVFNIVRHRHDRETAHLNTQPAPIVVTGPRLNTPAWAAFDHAASLRDAPNTDFQPALADLQMLIPLEPNQSDGHIADIHGCLTWLEFYRQGMAQATPDPKMKQRSQTHIQNCVKYHLDTTS
ncbi:MAG: hypothetical protein HIU91_05620 [Acidobacteria bacterium]|nr:hypothetical protein [Acidobacteriota bacterium]